MVKTSFLDVNSDLPVANQAKERAKVVAKVGELKDYDLKRLISF